jgi:hypothetical protein
MAGNLDFINFLKSFGRIIKIKLPHGLVSKIILLAIIAVFSLSGIALYMKNPWIASFAILIIGILCIVLPLNLIKFAKENPVSALLEGSQLIMHEKLQLASKEKGIIPVSVETKQVEKIVALSETDLLLVEQNDEIRDYNEGGTK